MTSKERARARELGHSLPSDETADFCMGLWPDGRLNRQDKLMLAAQAELDRREQEKGKK